jgi:spermidine synthase
MSQPEPQLIVNQQAADETIRVWQEGERRWLDFDDGLVQSEINLARPELLPLPLNRAMLAGILFEETPQRVLLVGTGGGATARYFSHRFPNVKGEAVEISESIISIAKNYFEFPAGEQWQIIHNDIKHYIQDCPHQYDLILIDIAVGKVTPEWIMDDHFLSRCRAILTPQGQVAFNVLVHDGNQFMQHLAAIRRIFERRTVCISMPNYRNTVILAFNNATTYSTISPERITKLERDWGIELEEFYQQMLMDNPVNSGVF